jgi:Tfp pilus assembly protein PilE
MIKSNQNGRSMIEMLGVLAIIGVLSVGGIVGYSKAMNKYKTNQVLNGVTHTINNIKTLFMAQNNVKGLSTKEAYQAGVVPDEFKADNIENLTKLVHSYGGEVKIVAKTVDGKDATNEASADEVTYYAIKINGLPRDVAMELATQYWGDSGDLVSVNLNDGNQPASGD